MEISLNNIEIEKLFKLHDLKIAKGQKILIQGPSGKGKTTLLHIIGGILEPHRGQVLIDGQNIYQLGETELSHFRRKKMALIYQKLNLIDHLSSLENLMLISPDITREQASETLRDLNLSETAARWASLLSLGEQQRVAIGRALLQKPEVLLADEPTSSLDKKNSENVMRLLLKAANDKTLIVVSHDERVEKYFDRVLQFEEMVR